MLKKFSGDLRRAKVGERIVMQVLQSVYGNDYDFNDVSDNKEYWHKGDIEIVRDGKTKYLDVKMDSRIAQTGNILCEDEVYFVESDSYQPGCIHSDYDYLAIISVEAKRIWIVDNHELQQHYKEGREFACRHEEQTTYGYLFPLYRAKTYGMIKAIIDYEELGGHQNRVYNPVNVYDKQETLPEAV